MIDMEWKIGQIFEHNGEWYQCIEAYDKCSHCDFEVNYYTCRIKVAWCSGPFRKDKKDVIFRKLKKVGEPFTVVGKLYQYYKVFDIDNVCGDGPWCVYNYKAKTLTIEIKQNKEEDMKTVKISKDDLNFLVNKIRYGILPKCTDYDEIISEITDLFSVKDINLSNSENIGKNLKPFDLQAAKAGKPVCTRDGRKAIFLTTLSNKNFPVVAIVSCGQEENIYQYDINGICDEHDENLDLMMTSEKKEGWVNVSKFSVFASKEEALSHKTYDIIETIKVSWEE